MVVEVANYNMRHVSVSFPCRGSRNCSAGGLYTKCTTTPGRSTVMNSALFSSETEMLLTFRSSLTKTELPYLLCGRSATSAIPGMLDLWLCGLLGDIDSGNVYPGTTLIVWMLY